MTEGREQFGCDQCWPNSADQAWQALGTLEIETALVDESHFTVKIRRCPVCAQRFLSVFTELVDWAGGDDPQSWTVLPVSEAEARALAARESMVFDLHALAPKRRSLHFEHGKGGEAHAFWGIGVRIGLHD